MKKMNDDLVDLCAKWILKRKASYLCKEDKVVWFASFTGREEDKAWQSMSLNEACRTIKIMMATPDTDLKPNVLLQAFQEQDEVYEVGYTSDYKVSPGIFNYAVKSAITTQEVIAKQLILFMSRNNIPGLKLTTVARLYDRVLTIFDISCTPTKRNKYLRKHAILNNYILRERVNRVKIKGVKWTAIIRRSAKPRDIIEPNTLQIQNMAGEIAALVKTE